MCPPRSGTAANCARARRPKRCWRACNPFAEFKMVRGLRPDDPPDWVATRSSASRATSCSSGTCPACPRSPQRSRASPGHSRCMGRWCSRGPRWLGTAPTFETNTPQSTTEARGPRRPRDDVACMCRGKEWQRGPAIVSLKKFALISERPFTCLLVSGEALWPRMQRDHERGSTDSDLFPPPPSAAPSAAR